MDLGVWVKHREQFALEQEMLHLCAQRLIQLEDLIQTYLEASVDTQHAKESNVSLEVGDRASTLRKPRRLVKTQQQSISTSLP